ncbi:hypothetical protein [Actinomadura decatromicini]|uniref:Uncharacterized protein n=1 Tax=Actinomadura decatromicini TaxID=2604572 RepID=A0A5D3FJF5_9ACTN|nr:hypothetical protein [Actinomadura decatromicini]TYK48158.1 hypothetical protein FXF68_21075 [Actinomadura decatromicini]
MTTDPDDEHGEILRRALHAEAETVNPAGDGLERIRARVAEGDGRRLGRFGLARYGLGFDRFTVNWARPILAVAAAVAIAGLGVTAPQTIDLIQQSVGANGPSGGGHDKSGGDRDNADGGPEFPAPASPGGDPSGTSAATSTTRPSTSPGLSSCTIPRSGTPTAAASPGAEPATPAPASSCPGQSPSQTPSATPTPPATGTPGPGEPTDQPTPPPSSEPAKTTNGEGAATGGS